MKEKPIIRKQIMHANFEYSHDAQWVLAINVNLDIRLQSVPVDGVIKYEIVKEIEEALKPIKEKYAP